MINNRKDRTNIALNKPASQTGAWRGLTADRAVDGQYAKDEEDFCKNVCAHPDTGNKSVPAQWWVDLGGEFIVDTIEIWNTFDSGGYGRMANFTVDVGSRGVIAVTCGTQGADPVGRGQSALYTCPLNTFGRRVYVRKTGEGSDPHLMMICEVYITGRMSTAIIPGFTTDGVILGRNIALGKPTNQTGVHQDDPKWMSSKAVDGRLDTETFDFHNRLANCARVDNPVDGEGAEFWVDLGETYEVTGVRIYNTYWVAAYFRLNNLEVSVIDPATPQSNQSVCSVFSQTVPQGGSVYLACNSIKPVGRYVRIRKTDLGRHLSDKIGRFSLCELKVYEEFVAEPHNYTDEQITVTDVRARSVVLAWEQITLGKPDSGLYGYRIQYWMVGRYQDAVTLDVAYSTSVTTVSRTLSNLSPNSQYKVTLTPYTRRDGGQIQMGTSYPEQNVTTPCGAPQPVENFESIIIQISGQNVESIVVTYQTPIQTGCDSITSVWASHGLIGSSSSRTTIASSPGTAITITVSTPGTYRLTLHVRNNDGLESTAGPWDVTVRDIVTPAPTPPQTPSPTTAPTLAPTLAPTPASTPAPRPAPTCAPTPAPTPAATAQTTEAMPTQSTGTRVSDTVVIAITVTVTVTVTIGVAAVLVTFLTLRYRRQTAANKSRSEQIRRPDTTDATTQTPNHSKVSLTEREENCDYEDVNSAYVNCVNVNSVQVENHYVNVDSDPSQPPYVKMDVETREPLTGTGIYETLREA